MALIAAGTRFPETTLPDLEGTARPLAEAWANGPALFILGHRDCKTTRDALPFVDRMHRSKRAAATALAILQDDADTARELRAEMVLELPVRLDIDPYPLFHRLGIETVPTLVLVGADGVVRNVSEAFRRDDLEAFAEALGVPAPLFNSTDKAPALRPG